jgi:signal peptidase
MTTATAEHVDAAQGWRAAANARAEHALRATNWRRLVFRLVLAIFVLLILVAYAVPLWFQLQGDRILAVTSGSMEPEIQPGDAVVIRPITDPSQLRVGQVVTFYAGGDANKFITHRITGLYSVVRRDQHSHDALKDQNGNDIVDPYISTKGDANHFPDPNLTPAAQVRGVVKEIHTGWGYLLGWGHSPRGRFLLFMPPLLMLLGAELISRIPDRWSRKRWAKTLGAVRDRERHNAGPLARDKATRHVEHAR